MKDLDGPAFAAKMSMKNQHVSSLSYNVVLLLLIVVLRWL